MNERSILRAASLGPLLAMCLSVGAPASAAIAQDELPGLPEAVSVTGTSTLVDQLAPGDTTLDGGVLRIRGNVLVTIEEASDPRVSGRATIDLDIDAYPHAGGLVAQIRFGTMRLENDAGFWKGRFAGRLTDRGFTQTYWLDGEGAYEGWSYVVTAGGNGPVWRSQGLIFPGRLPALGGPGSIDPGRPGILPPST